MLVRSLPTKNRKRLAGDVFYNFATNAGLTDDVTDTDCKARNLSTHGRIWNEQPLKKKKKKKSLNEQYEEWSENC